MTLIFCVENTNIISQSTFWRPLRLLTCSHGLINRRSKIIVQLTFNRFLDNAISIVLNLSLNLLFLRLDQVLTIDHIVIIILICEGFSCSDTAEFLEEYQILFVDFTGILSPLLALRISQPIPMPVSKIIISRFYLYSCLSVGIPFHEGFSRVSEDWEVFARIFKLYAFYRLIYIRIHIFL